MRSGDQRSRNQQGLSALAIRVTVAAVGQVVMMVGRWIALAPVARLLGWLAWPDNASQHLDSDFRACLAPSGIPQTLGRVCP